MEKSGSNKTDPGLAQLATALAAMLIFVAFGLYLYQHISLLWTTVILFAIAIAAGMALNRRTGGHTDE